MAEYKYLENSELTGSGGVIESPNYPKIFSLTARNFYRISVKQSSVMQIDFPTFSIDEFDDDECYSFLKLYNGYDESAPLLQDEMCGDTPTSLTSETNVVYVEFANNHLSRSKFQLTWKEVDRVINTTGILDSECGDKVISLNNETAIVNITSPGYPNGYGTSLTCTWTVVSAIQSFHPVISFQEVDLEDLTDCVGDYVQISTNRWDSTWKEVDKLCAMHARERKIYDGTPNLRIKFRSDYGQNGTGFKSIVNLECGGSMTDSEGIIEYNTTNIYSLYRIRNDCKWNITVRRGKTIQFEFLKMDIQNTSAQCNSYVTIRNGIYPSSPYLGSGQYCGKVIPTIPPSTTNRAFVKFKVMRK